MEQKGHLELHNSRLDQRKAASAGLVMVAAAAAEAEEAEAEHSNDGHKNSQTTESSD